MAASTLDGRAATDALRRESAIAVTISSGMRATVTANNRCFGFPGVVIVGSFLERPWTDRDDGPAYCPPVPSVREMRDSSSFPVRQRGRRIRAVFAHVFGCTALTASDGPDRCRHPLGPPMSSKCSRSDGLGPCAGAQQEP